MRGVKAKAIRKATKELTGNDVREALYNEWKAPQFYSFENKSTGEMVNTTIKMSRGIPCILAAGCGRSTYQKIKKHEKRGTL